MRSVVPTGRRMNGSLMLTARSPRAAPPAVLVGLPLLRRRAGPGRPDGAPGAGAGDRCALRVRRAALTLGAECGLRWLLLARRRRHRHRPGIDLRAGAELVLPVHHHPFPGWTPCATMVSGPCMVSTCTVRTATVLSGAPRRRTSPFGPRWMAGVGTTTTPWRVCEAHPRLHEQARPETKVGVGELGLEADGGGAGVHLVVDDRELAGAQLRPARRGPRPRPVSEPLEKAVGHPREDRPGGG